eukprot:COSAG02_NODE_6002_length_3882_cov_3.490087_2_plen_60_part_00
MILRPAQSTVGSLPSTAVSSCWILPPTGLVVVLVPVLYKKERIAGGMREMEKRPGYRSS